MMGLSKSGFADLIQEASKDSIIQYSLHNNSLWLEARNPKGVEGVVMQGFIKMVGILFLTQDPGLISTGKRHCFAKYES